MIRQTKQTILALETCTTACSVALWDGENLRENVIESERSHSQQLLPMVEQLLTEAGLTMNDLDAIACTRGPGAFTGLRIGVGAAKGLAFGQDLPIYAMSSLAALAMGIIQTEPKVSRIYALLDARMGELYAAEYDNIEGIPQLIGQEKLTDIAAIAVAEQRFVGTGALAYQAELIAQNASIAPIQYPTAGDVIRLVHSEQILPTTAAELAPIYLRDKVVG